MVMMMWSTADEVGTCLLFVAVMGPAAGELGIYCSCVAAMNWLDSGCAGDLRGELREVVLDG